MKLRSLNDESSRTGIRVRHFQKKKPNDTNYSDIDELNEYMQESLKAPPLKQNPTNPNPNSNSRNRQLVEQSPQQQRVQPLPNRPVQQQTANPIKEQKVETRQVEPMKIVQQAIAPQQQPGLHQIGQLVQKAIQQQQPPIQQVQYQQNQQYHQQKQQLQQQVQHQQSNQQQPKVIVQMPQIHPPELAGLQHFLRQPIQIRQQMVQQQQPPIIHKVQVQKTEPIPFKIQVQPVPVDSPQLNPMFMTLGAPQPQTQQSLPPPHSTVQVSKAQDSLLNDTVNTLSDPKILLQVENMQKQIQQLTKILQEKESRQRINDRRLEDLIRAKDQEIQYKDQEISRYLGMVEQLTQETCIKKQQLDLLRQELQRQRQSKQQLQQAFMKRNAETEQQPLREYDNFPKKQKQVQVRKVQEQTTAPFQKKKPSQHKQSQSSFTPMFEVKWDSPAPTAHQTKQQSQGQQQFYSPLSVSHSHNNSQTSINSSSRQGLYIEDSKQFRFEDLRDMSDC